MHELILTGILFMAVAATCFAQTTYQAGVAQKSVQTLIGSNHVSLIDQREGAAHNYGNMAVTTQSGTGNNRATINQKEGSASNYAEIIQADDVAQGTGGNMAFISQSNNSGAGTATVTVSSVEPAPGTRDGNYAFVRQVGHNAVYVTQNGDLFGISNGNVAIVDLHGEGTASINQSTNSLANRASIHQGTSLASAVGQVFIMQTGGTLGGSVGNIASINEQNASHVATIEQTNFSVTNQAVVLQEGRSDIAVVTQKDKAIANSATITQHTSTDFNFATITQTTNSQRNKATIDQYDTFGSNATISQLNESADNKAVITQGDTDERNLGNGAVITQTNAYATGGPSGNTATISQHASAGSQSGLSVNMATIAQGRNAASTGIARIEALGVSSQNNASVSQTGNDNISKVYQVGSQQEATITQTGSRNIVKGTSLADFSDYATQYGVGNSVNVSQIGGSTAGVFQYGTGNAGIISQSNN